MNSLPKSSRRQTFATFARFVSPAKTRFFQENHLEFVFGRREGPYVWDIDGRKQLIDCHCNGGVFNLGHRNPLVSQALIEALERLDIGNHHFVSSERAELAERLAALTPPSLQYSVFAASGGEAIDVAIKIVRKATGRRKIISALGGYHGHTGLAVAAGDAKYRDPFLSSSPDFIQIPFNDPGSLQKAMRPEVAGVVLETIPATLGMPVPAEDYFAQVRALCDASGAKLIIDEVQTGLGRTGTLWGIEQYGISPDVLVTGKGLSGGIYPIAAAVITPELESVFHDDPFRHISTFGGAELGCVCAREVLRMATEDGFLAGVNRIAAFFARRLGELHTAYAPLLAEVRQKGLMTGLKMAAPELGPAMTKACYEAGLLCIFAGNDPSVLQFLPPLITDTALAEEISRRLAKALELAAAASKQR